MTDIEKLENELNDLRLADCLSDINTPSANKNIDVIYNDVKRIKDSYNELLHTNETLNFKYIIFVHGLRNYEMMKLNIRKTISTNLDKLQFEFEDYNYIKMGELIDKIKNIIDTRKEIMDKYDILIDDLENIKFDKQ